MRAGQPLLDKEEPHRDMRSGDLMDILSTKVPIADGQGKIVGLVGITRDITVRKRAEAALRESEQRFRSFVEATTQVVWTTNLRGEVDMAIPSWQAYTGQTAEQARGFGWMNAIRAEDRQRVVEAWQKAFATQGLYEVEYLLQIHDGSWRNVRARGVPVRNPDGTVREYVGVCTDITARKQAEEALQESEQRFRTMADAIPQLAWIAHADGGIFWYNQCWYEYTGTTPEQMEGWGWQSVHDPQMLPAVLEAVEGLHRDRGAVRHDLPAPGGGRRVPALLDPHHAHEGQARPGRAMVRHQHRRFRTEGGRGGTDCRESQRRARQGRG